MRFFLAFLLLPLSAVAYMPQFKVSYFKPTLPTSKDFLKISTAEYQVEALFNISGGINAFGSVGMLNNVGGQDGRVFPVTFGAKYVKPMARMVSAYGYAGPRAYYFQLPGEKKYNRAKFSGVVGAGILSFMTKRLCIDSFAEWSSPSKVTGAEFGGWNVGTGFSYIF